MQPDIVRLVERIRDAGLAPEAWPDALKALTDALGVAGAACIISNKISGCVEWVCFSGLSAELQSVYVDHYAVLDPLTPLLNVDGGWTQLSGCIPESVLRRSEWYNDFVLSCGVRDILAARFLETSSHFATFGLHQRIGRRFADGAATVMEYVAGPLSAATLQHMDRLRTPVVHEIESNSPNDGARYYFHVRNGTQYPDEAGTVFPSRREALAHAAVLAAELAQDEEWDGYRILVTDAKGRMISQVPVQK